MVYAANTNKNSNNKIPIAILIVLNAYISSQFANAYKLNVPKVLLPFHSSKLVSFILSVETENSINEDLCFIWNSSRPDIVQITPIYDSETKNTNYKDEECSSKAIVSAVSKHPIRMNSVILAKEIKTDKLIRCDVIVDKINSIRIKHTTTHLFLEDSPELFTVEALDSDGNTFSSLDSLPFEWNIINDPNDISESDSESPNESSLDIKSIDSRNILKLGKFIDSEYGVSDSIRQLELIGLSGNKMLIEGVKTGTANVQAKLLDSFYKDTLKTPLVRLLVVANIILEPSYPIYILEGAVVKYNVYLIKQSSIETINLPSLQYFFESRNTTVANLMIPEIADSNIIGINLGSTEIVLIDRNMRKQQSLSSINPQIILPPPTATIHVVNPDSLFFTIKNWHSLWILEVGRTYEISVMVYTNQRQPVYPSENLKIQSVFDEKKFKLIHQSTNGSYHILTVLEKGITKAHAKLEGTLMPETNQIKYFKYKAQGEQEIELLDPIDVKPKLLIFALIPSYQESISYHNIRSYEYQLTASGGSGSYYWQSKNTTIASVNTHGVVKSTATRIGQTIIQISDTRNTDIQAKGEVHVLEPVDVQLLACPVETQVGNKLYLSVRMNAVFNRIHPFESSEQNLMPITDCSRLNFDVKIKDESIFKLVSVQSPSSISNLNPGVKDACAILVLDALRVGRSSIKLSTLVTSTTSSFNLNASDGELNIDKKPSLIELASSELLIGSYSQLKSSKTQIILSKDSSIVLNLYDGPLQSSTMSTSSQSINSPESIDTTLSSNYYSQVSISDESFIEVETIELDYMPNRYAYRIRCKKNFEQKTESQEFQSIKFTISHRKSSLNKCPVPFDYRIKIRCAEPYSIQLSQLFVNNDENTEDDLIFPNTATNLKWKCPIKLNSNLVMAHLDHPLLIQLIVRDSFNTVFDNFTSYNIKWKIENKVHLNNSHTFPNIRSIEIASSLDETGLILLTKTDYLLKSNTLFYQVFDIHSNKVKIDTTSTITGKLCLNKHKESEAGFLLSNTLSVNYVSGVKIEPQTLTIFNHPSNIVSLKLASGSGHYQGEIETLKSQINNDLQPNKIDSKAPVSNVLKINQITESSIVVSPLTNNGVALLHIYDYCVPPYIDILSKSVDFDQQQKRIKIVWPPAATSKIQVAGINSIFVNYDDEKVQINNRLKIYVQISDASGNLIKTDYFPLMGLTAKLLNSESFSIKGELTTNKQSLAQTDQIASIEPASLSEHKNSNLNDEDKDYTAIYILNAIRVGTVCVQFEANSDGQLNDKGGLTKSTASQKLIRSSIKEIQVYSPLNVQPKYIELIRGAYFQIVTTGGPPDASISYSILSKEDEKNFKKKKKIIEIDQNGIIQAMELGQTKVVAKSIGYACLPYSDKTISLSEMSTFRCNSENRIERVYSEDFLVVKVVDLRSINIQTPLKSIKKGNEMPIYIMGNEYQLNPLSFGSCSHLKFIWKINDQQTATLHHPLLFTSRNEFANTDDKTESEDLQSLFENSFSLRFLARKPGTVRISVRVEFKNGYHPNSNHYLTDTIEIVVFDRAYFTHLPPSYFRFIYPQFFSNNKLLQDLMLNQPNKALLMTPGSQLQVKTNMDKVASKISYELSFLNANENDSNRLSSSKNCNNNTILVNKEGLISVKHVNQHQLKHMQECSATLWVNVYLNENQGVKQQRLPYSIRIKPIVYSMVVLNKNSIIKISDSSFNRIRIDSKSLIRNKLMLNDAGIQTKWHIKYYDDLGDIFDVVNLSNEYLINRNDLVDLSHLNTNLFSVSYTSLYVSDEQSLKGSEQASLKEPPQNNPLKNPISLIANANENSFFIKTIKPGRFIMELTPFATSFKLSRDYLGVVIDQFDDLSRSEIDRFDGINANIGDLVCLNDNEDEDDYENDSESIQNSVKSSWTSQTTSTVKLISASGLADHSFRYSHFAVCFNEGIEVLKKVSPDPVSTVKLLKVKVKPIEKIKFINKSFKYITNTVANDLYDAQSTSKLIQFMSGATSIADHNCTEDFERFFKIKQASNSISLNDVVPFMCMASLFTKSGRKLSYLDRIIFTNVIFNNQHWTCNVTFAPNSNYILYDLIDNNIERPLTIDNADSLNEISINNEPSQIRIYIGSKLEDNLSEDSITSSIQHLDLPFVPAFYVQTKQIELPIVKAFSSSGAKSHSYSDHFKLVLYATHQLHAHLILTTNCPTLIQIKPLKCKTIKSNTGSLLSVTYDIVSSSESFDIVAYTTLLQQHKGELYVQITNSLNQQIERVPIKFLFNIGDGSRSISPHVYKEPSRGLLYQLFDLIAYPQNQSLSFFIMVSIIVITVLFILRIKTPSQRTAEQIALNASAAAAAAVAANAYSPTSALNSFNPYRYFSNTPEAPTPTSEYLRSRGVRSANRSLTGSPQNLSSGLGSTFRSRQSQLFSNRDDQTTPNVFYQSGRLSSVERDGPKLFSSSNSFSPLESSNPNESYFNH